MAVATGILRAQVRASLGAVAIVLSSPVLASASSDETAAPDERITIRALAGQLVIGDVVFIRVDAKPFREVAAATGTWTNHVGIVVDTSGDEPLIAESTFPLSRSTRLTSFIARSEKGRVAVRRLPRPLNADEVQRVREAVSRRTGIFYDTGFDLHSRREFCSR